MPPLAVVGYGLATWNLPVLLGALALFGTNFVTIALSATVMARFYGFGHALSRKQNWVQTTLLALVFVALSIPLGVSLGRIASEAVTVNQVRAFLSNQFGRSARISQVGVDFSADPPSAHAVVIAPRTKQKNSAKLQADLQRKFGRPITLQVDQLLVDPKAGGIEAQRAELLKNADALAAAKQIGAKVATLVALGAGVDPADVLLDVEHKRASATAAALPGASLETYRAIEQRALALAPDWRVQIIPPFQQPPIIRFANGSDVIDDAARAATLSSAWAARRWNVPALGVPGLPAPGATIRRPSLDQRRALAIAAILTAEDIKPVGLPAAGKAFRLDVSITPPAKTA
jgi:hypothetical protein